MVSIGAREPQLRKKSLELRWGDLLHFPLELAVEMKPKGEMWKQRAGFLENSVSLYLKLTKADVRLSPVEFPTPIPET